MRSPEPMTGAWPEHVRAGALRWARPSSHYEQTTSFYRDLVGLPVVGSFSASFGEDGTIFGLPDQQVQLEVVRTEGPTRPAGLHDHLVFHLPDADAVDQATVRLRAAGVQPGQDTHPYWVANGAVRFRDPDGHGLVYAPWIYGRDPDPVDRRAGTFGEPVVKAFAGDRATLRSLFERAEDSAAELDGYLAAGQVLVALGDDEVLGHLQLVDTTQSGVVELKNMAVREHLQGRGIGRALVRAAIDLVVTEGASRIVVATASADIGNLRFYQRQGFRFRSVERDAFTAATGYDEVVIDGIELRDRVWLDRVLVS